MNILLPTKSSHPFFGTTNFILCLLISALSIFEADAQHKPGKGGQPPNTKDNTTIPSLGKKDKTKASTPDNTTIGQPGDNNRFPSNKTATTKNKNLAIDEKKQKSKQNETGKFKGNDKLIVHPHHENPAISKERGNNSVIPDQSGYKDQRDKTMENREKPHMNHDFQGEIVVKKKKFADEEGDVSTHKNRQSAVVDHSKYQSYRKAAFDQKQSDMHHLSTEGTEQYGQRPSGEFFDLKGRQAMRAAKDREHFTYSGDVNNAAKEKEIKEKEKEISQNSGDISLEARDQKRRESQKEISNYSGDIDLTVRDQKRRESQKEISNYSGDIDLTARDQKRRESQKDIANYSGDISMNDVMRKAREIRKKEKTISNYSGDILVRTLKARDNRIRIKAKKIANWEGDVIIAKKRKGAHPSAAYRGGKVANSYKQKEKYRKQMLKKYGRNSGMETPNYQRKKDDKPTYDKEESKIWDVQKYRDSKTKETQ